MVLRTEAEQAFNLMIGAKRILILCHANPDGDAIGTLLGLAVLLQNHLSVPVEVFCKDPAPDTFTLLPGAARITHDPQPQSGDVLVVVDTAEPKLSGLHESHPHLFDGSIPLVNIDHHPTNTLFGQVNIIDAEACSACEIVVHMASHLGWQMNPDAATCLLTGMYTDTGGLLHSNTTAMVYRIVAQLLRAGARQQEIVKQVFRTSKLSTLKLWGRVLERISLSPEGGAVSAVTKGDFAASSAQYSELTGAIDYLNAVPGMRFSMILSERDGKVKGSLRTLRDDVDVAAMAGAFNGGGHKKAAGFALPGVLQPEIRWRVVPDQVSVTSDSSSAGVASAAGTSTSPVSGSADASVT